MTHQEMAELWAYRLASELTMYAHDHEELAAWFVVDRRYDNNMPVVSGVRLDNEEQFVAALQVRGFPFTRCSSDDGWEIYIPSWRVAADLCDKFALIS